MDPTKLLEADHRQVEALLDQIEKAEPDARQPLIDELVTSLRGHMELEEQLLYPAMAPVTGEDTVQEANTEHQLAREGIEKLLSIGPDGPGFGGALEMVKAGIQHHVEDEEGEVFPKLRKEMREELEAMASEVMAKRQELGLPADPAMLAKIATKEELMKEAEAAGLEGRSSMTKEQLAEALLEQS